MNFKKWLIENDRIINIHKDIQGEDPVPYFTLNYKNKPIGDFSLGHPGGENNTAKRMFPNIIKDNEKVSRIHGIQIDDEYQNKGLGQLLYLRALDKGDADWYYNSQTWPPATNALKTLAAKGYIKLYWQKEPNWNQEGGVHLIRITPKGRQAYRIGEMIKKEKFENSTP